MNPEAANICYTQAFKEIGLKKTKESKLETHPLYDEHGLQELHFKSKANYNPDWLNKDIPLPDETDTLRPPSQPIMGGKRKKRKIKTKRRKKRKRRKSRRKRKTKRGRKKRR